MTVTTNASGPWANDSYYHPKIHEVTEGLKSEASAKQYQWQFNDFLKHVGISNSNSGLNQLL